MDLTIAAGARPNFMKVAPIMRECDRRGISFRFVHTGQHYDQCMSDGFISCLGIPQPDVNLEVGSGTAGYQTGEVIKRFEADLLNNLASLVIVVGDVNSTLGVSLAASKLNVPIVHIEAGLRSFNREMPEEINRVVVDSIADFLFTTEESGNINLMNEGRKKEVIFLVGNTMIDSLVYVLDAVGESDVVRRLGLKKGGYCYVTLHRPSNVDSPERLEQVLCMLEEISTKTRIVFPVHPRTEGSIDDAGLRERVNSGDIGAIEPVDYIDSITLISNSKFVITDSGGIQEETTFLKVPCLTLRPETERPVTVELGTNMLVSDQCHLIQEKAQEILDGYEPRGKIPPYWDGKASQRVVNILEDHLG